MKEKDIYELIGRSLKAPLNAAENLRLLEWLDESDENKLLYAKIRDVDTLSTIANADKPKDTQILRTKGTSRRIQRWIGIAAAFVLVIGASTVVWRNSQNNKDLLVEAQDDILFVSGDQVYNLSNELPNGDAADINILGKLIHKNEDAKTPVLCKIIVPKGKTFQLLLHDGTKVELNASSELSFMSAFIGQERAVELNGEAYFDVKKDASRVFKIKTRQSEIRVLGTEFNVLAYDDQQEEKVSLDRGAVEVSNGTALRQLTPGEQSTVSEGVDIQVASFAADQVSSWREGVFLFDNETLDNVLLLMEKWYDVKFEFTKESLKGIPVYIKMNRSRSIEDLMMALKTTNQINFKQSNNIIYVTP